MRTIEEVEEEIALLKLIINVHNDSSYSHCKELQNRIKKLEGWMK